jgi:hypothetical protein
MTRISEVCDRWVARNTDSPDLKPLRVYNVYGTRDVLYSWGSHFELARALRDRAGTTRLLLLNGDTFSVSTGRHQNALRDAVDRSGRPSVIIPFSALAAAGIELDSVVLLDRTENRHERTEHVAATDPGAGHWARPVGPPDGSVEYRWSTYRHWLGESLIQAKVSWAGKTPCRSASCHAGTIQPELPPDLPERWLRQPHCRTCSGTGYRYWTRHRTTRFLSGFDHGEARPSYFFCELPRCRAGSIPAAYEALKPDVVRLAEQMGRTVARQGDIFAVPLSAGTTKRSLRKAGAVFERSGQLLGTNHAATEVARLPDGTTLARGTLHHRPEWRRPDHARVHLGNRFHAVVKNTVPTTRARGGR